MTRRAVLAGVTAAAAAGPLRAEAATSWRIVTEYPATAMPGEGVTAFAQAASGASLTVSPLYDGADGLRSAGMLQAVAQGRVEAADAFTGALAREAALFQLSALPFLTASTADTARLLRVARPYYEGLLAGRGVKLLYATPWPATGLWSRRPVADAAALRGLRVRTYDAAGTAVFRQVGAEPAQVSFADALPRVRAGELDAVLSSGDGGAGARLWELLPYFTVLDYASPLSLAFCGSAALSRLPEAQRAVVLQAGVDTEARQFRAIAGRAAENDARIVANGVTVLRSPAVRTMLAEAAAPVTAEWEQRAGPDAAAILAGYRAG